MWCADIGGKDASDIKLYVNDISPHPRSRRDRAGRGSCWGNSLGEGLDHERGRWVRHNPIIKHPGRTSNWDIGMINTCMYTPINYSLHNLMDQTAHPSNGRGIGTARIAGAVINTISVQIFHPAAVHGTVDGILAHLDIVVTGPRSLKAPLMRPNQRLHRRTVAVGEASLGTVSRMEE